MKIRRKYNLSRVGQSYESIDIEIEGDSIQDIIKRIDEAWKAYCKAIVEGKVQ